MARKIIVFGLILFFAAGMLAPIAEAKSGCEGKSGWQCVYDWFAGVDKMVPAKTGEIACKACGKTCCKTCQTDCGGKCCVNCTKK